MLLVPQFAEATGDDGAGSVPMLIGTAVVVLLVLAGIRGRDLRPRKLFVLPGIVVLIGLAAVLPPPAGGSTIVFARAAARARRDRPGDPVAISGVVPGRHRP
ncbi:hypothetical protein [Amycolatopsis sp. DG1A-15b]|uniref:hypothetical protein n=1 Tax=Amycolatopsis sp. DG1A-15b TaxID=3052846 RepID=UPI00255B65A6|nr:hypothetical protein [Amycolatopsis sp. DG1A-15b]WIX89914.1 hypothetical protein QRY02_05550 [Amycolatopsis sp. DG1A-15b]